MLSEFIAVQYCYEFLIDQISVNILLYAHIPTSLIALGFSIFVLRKRRSTASSSLFLVTLCFTAWSFLNLNAWFSFLGIENMMFTWSLIDLFGILFFIFSYRFLYAYIYSKDLPLWQWIITTVLVLFAATSTLLGMNLDGYYLDYCEAGENETVLTIFYLIQLLYTFAALYIGVQSIVKFPGRRKEILLATAGVVLFLGFFVLISYFVSFLVNYTSVEHPYNFEIYGLFGMPVLLVFLGYLIVRFKAFNIGLLGAQALVATLAILVGAQLFIYSSISGLIVNIATLFLTLIFGYFLVKSVKRETEQRHQIEHLAKNLEKANERLKVLDKMKSEFVSIASHQLRSPLTAIRGYTSMLLEGSYGKITKKATEAVQRIADSSRFMALSVEDYLNVSRIEAGNMKYEIADFNLKETAEKIVDEMRPAALKKGLILIFRSDCDGSCSVHADIGKTRQVILNLIDNAMKYTPKGGITVFAHDDPKKKKMYVSIKDTGVGMSKDTIDDMFDKFVRAKNANEVNVTGTGLGLYVAKKMIDEMGGRIWAESEGEGKGSIFHIELPLLPGKYRG